MNPQTELQPAYLLHSRPYRETSLLLEILTERSERVGMVAQGARRRKSPKVALLQLFQPLLISWQGRGDLGTLTSVEFLARSHRLTGNRLASGFYINELVVKLIERNDPHPCLYDIYRQTLGELEFSDGYERGLRLFEKRLLDILGYGLNLEYDVGSGHPLHRDKYYFYQPDEGPKEVAAQISGELVIRGSTLIGLREGDLAGKEELDDAKRLLRSLIQNYLGDAQIRSRELLIPLKRR